MTPPTAPERCTVCDRPLAVGGCPRFRASSATSWTAHEWKSAAFDCHAHRVDWHARAIAAEARGTVGGLLATACEGEIVEFDEGSWWMQITVFGGIVRWRVHDSDDGWHPYIDDPSSWHCDEFVAFWLAKPARLVSAAEADADPNQRGPLPKGG